MRLSLSQRMKEGGYDGYSYAYPHKTAYRPIDPSTPLRQAWEFEDKHNLFLYLHLPFCEMRCGFCNLFTSVRPESDFVIQTLAAIKRQSEAVVEAVAPQRIAQAAFGGGTPSFLSSFQIEELFDHLRRVWPFQPGRIPISFEMSPGTISEEKLALLRSLGVDRISLGAQSFVAEDLISLKRPQPLDQLRIACRRVKSAGFPVFNIDLIYGNEGQDVERWQRSLRGALAYQPEEIYLYPLYIPRLTNLARGGKHPGELRHELYRQGRDVLRFAGYRQISMRLFRRQDVVRTGEYCCQDDGMIGLGPGARSYTRSLHYSSEYAVAQPGVRGIIEKFNARSTADHIAADFGIRLDLDEQKLRYIIKSLLRADGISNLGYHSRFGTLPAEDFPQLSELFELDLAVKGDHSIRLNEEGMSWSDTIGPWLYSETISRQMGACELS
jgi:oxygen-independent coproporphyrinogen-3 oxidase